MRDSAGLSGPSTSVCPNRELLSSSSLDIKNKTIKVWKHPESASWTYFFGNYECAVCVFVCKRDLLQSFIGIPSIFALMSFLFFLMAEPTASNRKPGHLSSFRISLQKQHKHFNFKQIGKDALLASIMQRPPVSSSFTLFRLLYPTLPFNLTLN